MAVKAIDWMNYLNTDKGIARFKGAPELARLLKWWGMEDRYVGKTGEQMVAEMDEAGVEATVICAVKMASYREKKVIWEAPYEEVVELMRRLNREQEITFAIVTHDIAVGRRADRILRMMDGQIVEEVYPA